MSDARYLFFIHASGSVIEPPARLPPRYSWRIWWPTWRSPWMPGAGAREALRYFSRTLVYAAGGFSGEDCGALIICSDRNLVHYSGFTPRYWRFPFMADADLQIGDTWTHPAHRGSGLALFALTRIINELHLQTRRFWYVVEDYNHSSIRVAQKAALQLAAEGTWRTPLGLKALGAYVIRESGPSGIRQESGCTPASDVVNAAKSA